jgi:hypothetical protein
MIFKWVHLEDLEEYENKGWTLVSIRMSFGNYTSFLMKKEDHIKEHSNHERDN